MKYSEQSQGFHRGREGSFNYSEQCHKADVKGGKVRLAILSSQDTSKEGRFN